MPFKRGPQYRVFITTENPSGSILATGSVPVATTSSGLGPNAAPSLKGVGKLGEVTSTASTASEIKNLEGIEPVWRWEDDPFTVFGQTRPLNNPIRKTWELTLTKKGEDRLLVKLADMARFGVTGTTPALFDGLDTMPDSTGYRLYIWDGESFYVGYQGTINPDGYKETLSPTGVTVQTIVFSGGRWSASINAGDAALTSSVPITQ